jgi:hypothetical protein
MPAMILSMLEPLKGLLLKINPIALGLFAALGVLTAGVISFAMAAERGKKEGVALAGAMNLTNDKLIKLQMTSL